MTDRAKLESWSRALQEKGCPLENTVGNFKYKSNFVKFYQLKVGRMEHMYPFVNQFVDRGACIVGTIRLIVSR